VSLVVLLILAVVWAVFLIPQVARFGAEKTRADSIGVFRTQLSVLERATPAPWGRSAGRPGAGVLGQEVLAPPVGSAFGPAAPATTTKASVVKRRRDIVLVLLAGMGGTLLLGILPPLRFLLGVHLALDLVFVAYLGLLARARTIAAERDIKVRYLPERASGLGIEPALMLQRSGT
jgi:hypothetical protein